MTAVPVAHVFSAHSLRSFAVVLLQNPYPYMPVEGFISFIELLANVFIHSSMSCCITINDGVNDRSVAGERAVKGFIFCLKHDC